MASGDRTGTGGASDSTFSHNYVGAYAAEASGLHITGSVFDDNVIQGHDPNASDGTVVEPR